jgi:pyridoxal biosynthesis lyase PdxS
MDFQNQNMQANAAQQAKDTAVITLMKGYSDIQAEGAATKTKYTTYANHILNHISVF